jgi:hypothetical protein
MRRDFAVALGLGPERGVVRATADQQPFGARWFYRLAQVHIRRAGIYCRLEPPESHPAQPAP